MRKLLAITLAAALLLSIGLASPILAQTVPTEVNVNPGEGDSPIIKVKWETPDHDLLTPGTQVEPPMAYEGEVEIQFWAIVTHPAGKDNVAAVYVDVWYPDIMSQSAIGGDWCGMHKFQLRLQKVDKFEVGKPAFEEAWANGTITEEHLGIDPVTDAPFTYDEIIEQLDQCSADVYKVTGIFHYHQPAGDYDVRIKAVPLSGQNAYLWNTLTYLEGAGFEIDFDSINYGSVTPCVWKQLDGDRNFRDEPGPFSGLGTEKGTVRNIGNTDIRLTVHQTDLWSEQEQRFLGMTGDEWNVEFAARLGSAADGYARQEYEPCDAITLDKILPVCNTDKLDLWIHIRKLGTSGAWTSDLTLDLVVVPFMPCELPS